MKHNTYTILKWPFQLIYLLLVFIFIKNSIQPELHYHAQQPPFILDWNFFTAFLRYPGGLAKYITNFLLQSFYYPWSGSFVILATGLLFLVSSYFVIKSFDKSDFTYFLMYIPFILFIILLTNYYFPFVVVFRILFVFLALWLLTNLLNKGINFIATFSILSLLIYYLSGSGSLLVFSASSIGLIALKKYSLKSFIFHLGFVVLFTFLIDFIAYKYVFVIYPENIYFSFLLEIDYYMDAFMNYKPNILFYLFCYSMPVVVLLLLVKNRLIQIQVSEELKPTKPISTLINVAVVIIIIGITFFLGKITFDTHKKNIILADYYCYNERWKDAIDIALSDPQYSSYINYSYNRAIDNYGNFPDMFFKYPQHHIFALYPDRMVRGNPSLSHIISDYYFDLGYISISQQWAQATLALMPYNTRALKRMVITNLIYGNYNASETFLNLLSKDLVSKDFVHRYMPYIQDTTLVAKDKLLMEKRLSMPKNKEIPENITERFKTLLEYNKRNKRAYEHLQMSYLLVQNLDYFINNIAEAAKFYNQTPEIFEQAILMYVFITDISNLSKFNISKGSLDSFKHFIQTLQAYNNDKNIAKSRLSKYSTTYMYYVTYFSPPDAVNKSDSRKQY